MLVRKLYSIYIFFYIIGHHMQIPKSIRGMVLQRKRHNLCGYVGNLTVKLKRLIV